MNWVEANKPWRLDAEEAWKPRQNQPLRLRAWLSSPLAWDGWDPLTIEGALQSVVVLRQTGKPADDVFSNCPIEIPIADTDIPIPIVDRHDISPSSPIALASCGVLSPGARASLRWRRSRPRAELYRSEVVKIATAEMKAHNLPSPTVAASYVDFYVVGDATLLRDLLRDVSSLGSKRGGGLGQVQGWEVEVMAGDYSLVGPQGQLMRTLPVSAGIKAHHYDEREATLRAPYWHPRTRCNAHVPIMERGS